jgi:hypothetical protein
MALLVGDSEAKKAHQTDVEVSVLICGHCCPLVSIVKGVNYLLVPDAG